MTNDNKNEPSANAGEPDELALETAIEISPELLSKIGEIMNQDITEIEQEQKINNLVEEMNRRANEIYKQKKQQNPD